MTTASRWALANGRLGLSQPGTGRTVVPPWVIESDLTSPTAAGAALAAVVADARVAEIPPPGGGHTGVRFALLAEIASIDVTLGRLVEAHTDAQAIISELTASPSAGGSASVGQALLREMTHGQTWGVWAAEHPAAGLAATSTATATTGTTSSTGTGTGRGHGDGGHDDGGEHSSRWHLTGRKAWCSGAPFLTHALVTAPTPAGGRLFAVSLDAPGVTVEDSAWTCAGMSGTATTTVSFDQAPATPVGAPGTYLDRPGFWHGAAGVAACWYGAAVGVARALASAARTRPLDAYALAHLGAVDAALAGARALLEATAERIDADPADGSGAAEQDARRLRAVVEHAADEVLSRVGRALGPAAMTTDRGHARRIEDLTVYLRQSHAERDLALLGSLLADREPSW